jgi:hydrogenase nickel incorporation protein HypA/HybF
LSEHRSESPGEWGEAAGKRRLETMHELSIVESLLSLALQNAEKANARRIVSIGLVVGDYTGVMEDAVNLYFGFSAKTRSPPALKSATRMFRTIALPDCDLLFPLQKQDYVCPKCEGKRVEIVGGRELYIESMEID